MVLLLIAVALLVASGIAALLAQAVPRWCTRCGAGGAMVACTLGLVPSVRVLLGGSVESLHRAWAVPYGAFFVEADALSAVFLLPIFALSGLAAVYGAEYSRGQRRLGTSWFFFNLLVGSMVMVVLARNAVLFLMAWEVMALASFFLVTLDDEQASVRQAGWTYLIAMHLGTAFVLALFILLGRPAGSLDFDRFASSSTSAGLLFLLAVIGFGTKAGFVPLHVWLPEAHPAAPSHVSAVMSGVMIKTGIYGLLRVLAVLTASAAPPVWWGWLLVAIGVTSGVYGIVFALAQRDLKRLLAYSSVENIGIITLGIGIGVLGMSTGRATLSALGFAGALLHVWNHAAFKGLLFLGAGSVAHATGTRDVEELGGLLTRMPWTGVTFLIGALAICGLPPLNGFVSELLLYLAALDGATVPAAAAAVPALGVIAALALIGGLAAAGFTKAFGTVFLGEPRSGAVAHAHESGPAIRVALIVLATACGLIGMLSPLIVPCVGSAIAALSHDSSASVHAEMATAVGTLRTSALVGGGFLALVGLVVLARRRLLSARSVEAAGTWDCGYAQPTARMQYTAASFAQPLTTLFGGLLRTQRDVDAPRGWFPRAASFATTTPDVCGQHAYTPLFAAIGRGLGALRWLQHGEVHLYVLYIALTLLVLLVWRLG